jgi:hypothetical protein
MMAWPCITAPQFKSYTSPNGEYTVKYPESWVHYPKAQSLYILNFPVKDIVREVLLPPHGAMITFALRQRNITTLEDWIAKNIKLRGVIEKRTFPLESESNKWATTITEVVSQSARGSQEFKQVDWYFSIDGRIFDAVLLYRKDDKREHEYADVLRHVVASLIINS